MSLWHSRSIRRLTASIVLFSTTGLTSREIPTQGAQTLMLRKTDLGVMLSHFRKRGIKKIKDGKPHNKKSSFLSFFRRRLIFHLWKEQKQKRNFIVPYLHFLKVKICYKVPTSKNIHESWFTYHIKFLGLGFIYASVITIYNGNTSKTVKIIDPMKKVRAWELIDFNNRLQDNHRSSHWRKERWWEL